MKNPIIFLTMVLLGIVTTSCHKSSQYFPLTEDALTEHLDYNLAMKWHENYLDHEHRLSYNIKKPSKTIKGFTIEKKYIDSLFKENDGINELFIFFGAKDKDGKITIIFSELDTAYNTCTKKMDTTICKTLLYEYVDPCPDKCPKFK